MYQLNLFLILILYGHIAHWNYPNTEWSYQAWAIRNGSTLSGPKATIGKPFQIAETGAGGIYDWKTNDTLTNTRVNIGNRLRYTLKYQADIIGRDVDTAIGNPPLGKP